jgi:hypothetical protein
MNSKMEMDFEKGVGWKRKMVKVLFRREARAACWLGIDGRWEELNMMAVCAAIFCLHAVGCRAFINPTSILGASG